MSAVLRSLVLSVVLLGCSGDPPADGTGGSASGTGGSGPGGTDGGGGSDPDGSGGAAGGDGGAAGGSISTGGNDSSTGGEGEGEGGGGGAPGVFVARIQLGDDRCLPRELATGEHGRVGCGLAEAVPGPCDCETAGRTELTDDAWEGVQDALVTGDLCGADPDCETFCACGITQVEGGAEDPESELTSCQTEVTPDPTLAGFCYIDAEREPALGNPDLVDNCPTGSRRRLRVVGDDIPLEDAVTFLVCEGQ